ncbi:MAG: hypothetical protein J0L51_02920 [Rhizobiales bacterium]|nr:hypothetical protein [Hyphomicrobiales bacterium]
MNFAAMRFAASRRSNSALVPDTARGDGCLGRAHCPREPLRFKAALA